ncbi:MAG: class II fructose-bisphosphate aldolase [Planctomycetota bacterium]
MPMVNDYHEVCDVYAEARERNVCLPCFCAEDMETIEALLMAAHEFGETINVPNLPIIVSWTSRYPGRPQMRHITASGNVRLGVGMMFALLREFASPASPYRALRILPHLDHAFPWLDEDVLNDYIADFASVMFDASEKPFEENVKLTARYVEKAKGLVVVEGAADEIFESGSTMKNSVTTVEQAARFVRETGVNLIVPNLGTEHRATQDKVQYASDQAGKIRDAIGSIMVLHGTSSLKMEDLGSLWKDGIIKANIYTALAKAGGQAVAHAVLQNLGNMFDADGMRELNEAGMLGEYYRTERYRQEVCLGKISPKLDQLCSPPRRNAWTAAVKKEAQSFLRVFNYHRFAR